MGLSELLRSAMARTRTWTSAAAEVERERIRECVFVPLFPNPRIAL